MNTRTFLSLSLLLTACLKPYPVDWDGDGVDGPDDCDDLDPALGSRTIDPDCNGLDTGSGETDNTTETGRDSAEDTETDAPPTLTSLEVEEISATSGTQLKFSFEVEDPDGDIEGGVLRLANDNSQELFLIPDSISNWDGRTGSVSVNVWVCDLTTESTDWEATVLDVQGNTSAPRSTTFTSRFLGRSYLSIEWGDEPMLWDGPDSFEPPFLFCGDTDGTAEGFWSGGDPATGHYGHWPAGADVDFVKVYAATWTTSHGATLNWKNTDTQLEFGRFLLNGGTWQHDSPVGGYLQPGVRPLQHTITASYHQFLYVRGYSGPATEWSVIIE